MKIVKKNISYYDLGIDWVGKEPNPVINVNFEHEKKKDVKKEIDEMRDILKVIYQEQQEIKNRLDQDAK